MMDRWGLEGMRSFEQVNVARKEGAQIEIPDQAGFRKEADLGVSA